MPENVWSRNTASQTQGEDNSVALGAQGDEDGDGGDHGGTSGGTRRGGPGDDDEKKVNLT